MHFVPHIAIHHFKTGWQNLTKDSLSLQHAQTVVIKQGRKKKQKITRLTVQT